jgi:hypothetical protein
MQRIGNPSAQKWQKFCPKRSSKTFHQHSFSCRYYGFKTYVSRRTSANRCQRILAVLEGNTLTNFFETKLQYQPCVIDVLSAGSSTTVQDFPARTTSGHGIPKGGPMNNLSSRSSRYSCCNKHEADCSYSWQNGGGK